MVAAVLPDTPPEDAGPSVTQDFSIETQHLLITRQFDTHHALMYNTNQNLTSQ